LPNVNELTKTIKMVALGAVEASKPVNVLLGRVISNNPLQIRIDQKMLLGEKQLIVAGQLQQHDITITDQLTGETKQITIHGGLSAGSNVILIRQQGGQKYVVVDKI
jgi:hypothetical protein